MADESRETKPGFFTRIFTSVKSAFKKTYDSIGNAEWYVADKLLGEKASNKLAQSVDAYSQGQIKEGWNKAGEAKREVIADAGAEGAALSGFGPAGVFLGGMVHRVTGSPDVKPVTSEELKTLTLSGAISRDAKMMSDAYHHDIAKVKALISGGEDVKHSPLQSSPANGLSRDHETKR